MTRLLVPVLRRPVLDLAVVPRYLACLDERRGQGKLELAGPFGDQSGGACLLRADDLTEAIAYRDPAHLGRGWQLTVHEWRAK